jgi:hypothetical protein
VCHWLLAAEPILARCGIRRMHGCGGRIKRQSPDVFHDTKTSHFCLVGLRPITPSIPGYKGRAYKEIQTLGSLINNLSINFIFLVLSCKFDVIGFVIKCTSQCV